MSDMNNETDGRQPAAEDRRAFLAKAGKVAVAAPAAALLLAATTQRATAAVSGEEQIPL